MGELDELEGARAYQSRPWFQGTHLELALGTLRRRREGDGSWLACCRLNPKTHEKTYPASLRNAGAETFRASPASLVPRCGFLDMHAKLLGLTFTLVVVLEVWVTPLGPARAACRCGTASRRRREERERRRAGRARGRAEGAQP